jgi:uncharacterized protein YjbI with pentapeptide repeats
MNHPYFHKFKVEIVNKPYYTETGINYPKTAVISFYNQHERLIGIDDYGYLPTADVYDRIEHDKALNLDECYVKDFSFTAYRRLILMNKADSVKLKNVSAKNAFFHSTHVIDFSHLDIESGTSDFSGCCFIAYELTFINTKFGSGNVDFSYSLFRNEKNDFSNIIIDEGDIIFKNSIFTSGIKNFQYAAFGKGFVNFTNTEFNNGDVSFLNTYFGDGKVSFKVARFGEGKVDFHYSKFGKGDISFERTEFGNGVVDFKAVEFNEGKVNFNRAVFDKGEATFEGSSTKGRITFKKTVFNCNYLSFEIAEYNNIELNLEKAIFNNCNLSFYGGIFKKLSLKGCHLDDYVDMRVRKCNEIDISDTVIRDIIDFKPFEFDIDLNVLNISAVRLLGTIYIDWENNNVNKLISNQSNTSLLEKAEQFRVLKENFNSIGQYKDEDKSYVCFMRYEQKAEYVEIFKNNKLRFLYKLPVYIFKKVIFDYVGLYATSPLRVLASMLVAYILFSLIYFVVLLLNIGDIVSGIGGEHAIISTIGKSFYHSGITFFTIGYGDFYPLGLVRWLSQIEGFTGVFLMSYFTVAFVHKILR